MRQSSTSTEVIRLAGSEFDSAQSNPYRGWHAAAPIMFGFAVPLVALTMVRQSIVLESAVLTACLLSVMVLAAALFVASLIAKGSVAAVIIEPASRRVSLVHRNAFATTTSHVALDRVTEVKSVIEYDSEGRKRVTPRLQLVSGKTVPLPTDVDRRNLEAARQAVASFRAMNERPAPVRRRPLPRLGQRAA